MIGYVPRSSYDSEFLRWGDMEGNAILRFRIRTHLRPYVPQPKTPAVDWERVTEWGGRGVRMIPWEGGEAGEQWRRWRARFKQVVEASWNDKLWLLHRVTRQGLGLPNIACRLSIDFVTDPARAHLRAPVYRLHSTETYFRSSLALGGNRDPQVDDGKFGHLDLDREWNGHVTAVHELAHFLGQEHPGLGPGVADGSPEAYGDPDSDRGRNVTGWGGQIAWWNAWPWIHRLPDHRVDQDPDRIYPGGIRWAGTTHRPPRFNGEHPLRIRSWR